MVAQQPAAETVDDQVPRLKAWLAAHPRCTIQVRDGMWVCAEPLRLAAHAVAYDLGILLDRLEAEEQLEELRHRHGEAYQIERTSPLTWLAARRDGGGAVHANSAGELEAKIVADYALRPVPRDGSAT